MFFGMTGRKGHVGGESIGLKVKVAKKWRNALETNSLERDRGEWNFVCRGEIWRSTKEGQKRRQLSGSLPTLGYESMGS
ncbi:hypothetical protein M6B38_281840 [Iris pallida]|uniref:Uncharacterized protein n=1 Tax=Iris pallida TaxID=29817 RepID=A0AAX6I0J4_IRIPA|nr:hypothetical protein M6B38_281840 [Iris pallida]